MRMAATRERDTPFSFAILVGVGAAPIYFRAAVCDSAPFRASGKRGANGMTGVHGITNFKGIWLISTPLVGISLPSF